MLIAQEGTGPRQGDRFLPYQDTKGLWTIGYGRCLSKKGINPTEAMMLFSQDIADAMADARSVCSCYDQLSEPRRMVLVSMAYNLGRGKLSGFALFLDALHRGDYTEAAHQIRNSRAALQDAPTRYAQLADMMERNESPWV